jgi:hypothetical protein
MAVPATAAHVVSTVTGAGPASIPESGPEEEPEDDPDDDPEDPDEDSDDASEDPDDDPEDVANFIPELPEDDPDEDPLDPELASETEPSIAEEFDVELPQPDAAGARRAAPPIAKTKP